MSDSARLSPEHVRALGAAEREAVYQLGEADLSLRRIGRFVNVLPVAIFALYPILLPWLLRAAWRMSGTFRSPALRMLRRKVDFEAVNSLKAGRKTEQIEDAETRALIALRTAPLGLGLALVGPPALVAGFVALWWVLTA